MSGGAHRVEESVLTHLDLFSGIGGFALAARWVGGIRTIGFCEIEDYGCRTLEKNFPGIPIYKDVRELHPDELISRDGRIDFLTAGFPCQDLSVAGNQAGIEADRSGLFFQITRLSDEIYAYCGTRPSLVLENVSNILAGAGGDWARAVYGELAVRGYYCEWKVVSASDVGAPHQRKRWWCIAYMADASSGRTLSRERGTTREIPGKAKREKGEGDKPTLPIINSSEDVAHSRHSEPPGWDQGEEGQQSGRGRKAWGESSSCSSVADTKSHDNQESGRSIDSGRKNVSRRQSEIRPEPPGRSDVVADSGFKCLDSLHDEGSKKGGSKTSSKGAGDSGYQSSNYMADSSGRRCKQHQPKSKQVPYIGLPSEETGRIGHPELQLGGSTDGIPPGLDFPRRWRDGSWEEGIPRVTTGQKNRVARLKGLGNAVVPQVAMIPLMRLKEILL